MVVTKTSRTAAGSNSATVAKKKFAITRAMTSTRKGGKKKFVNLSRKQVMAERRDKMAEKRHLEKLAKKIKKSKEKKGLVHKENRKANRTFDHQMLKLVSDSLTESIELLGEKVTPLSLFACAQTTLASTPNPAHVPYLMAIIAAIAPKVSPGVLMSRMNATIQQVQHALAGSDNLTSSKAIKMIQAICVAVNPPTPQMLAALRKLEPNKHNASLMASYVATLRKYLQHAFVEGHFDFFLGALPEFVDICVQNFVETKESVAKSTKKELLMLFDKTFTPKAVEYGAEVIDTLISKLCSVYKAHFKEHWALVAEIVQALFTRLSFVKRTPNAAWLTKLFPSAAFLLRVLDKIRQAEDATLNGAVTKAIAAIASGMRAEELLSVLPFDPQPDDVSNFAAGNSNVDPWRRSYLVNIIRQTAGHDSLPFFVNEFLPRIQRCKTLVTELTAAGRHPEAQQWSQLEFQYWRIAVGFCNHPVEVTNESFRALGKALTGLLTTPYVDVAAQAIHTLCSGLHRLAMLPDDDSNTASNGGGRVAATGSSGDGKKRRLADASDDDDDDEDEDGLKPADEDEELLALTDDGWNPHVFHNISQAQAQAACAIIAQYSLNIMPKLCNAMETHDTTSVMNAIESFSKVCSPQVMGTIFKGILDLGSNISEFPEANAHSLSSKRRVVLDIAYAIAGQLTLEHVESVYNNIVEPVLSDTSLQNRLLQKKAYKLLFALFDKRLKDILPFMPRIVNLLTVGQHHVTVSGLKMRVKCLSWALDAYKMFDPTKIFGFVKQSLPEVIMFAKERSGDARDMAMDMLERMHHYATSAGAAPNTLINLAVAGLAGKTPMLVSATIVALAKLVWVAHFQLRVEDMTKLNQMMAGLLEHPNAEVRAAAATFLRMMIKAAAKHAGIEQAVRATLPRLSQAIAIVTSQSMVSSGTRDMMKVLVERCIKQYGVDEINAVFPAGSQRFVQYVAKGLRRAERREERERQEAEEAHAEDEFNRHFMGVGGLKAGDEENDEADGDLLHDGGLKGFVATRSALPFRAGGSATNVGFGGGGGKGDDDEDAEEDARDDLCIVQEEGGKIRIVTRVEKRKEDELARRKALADRLLRRGGAAGGPSINARDLLRDAEEHDAGKRKRDDVTDFENEELLRKHGGAADESFARAQEEKLKGNKGITAAQLQRLRNEKAEAREEKRKRMEQDIKTGEEFQTDRGFGDVKRGAVDPFAYVPLNRKFLNKRNMRFADTRLDAVTSKSFKGEKARRIADEMKRKPGTDAK